MGLLDQPEFADLAGTAYRGIDAAQVQVGQPLSAFARELIAVWAVSLAYEPSAPEPPGLQFERVRDPDRQEVFDQLLNLLPSALNDMRDSPTVFNQPPQVVRSVDVFYWLAERGDTFIAQSLFCPFEK